MMQSPISKLMLIFLLLASSFATNAEGLFDRIKTTIDDAKDAVEQIDPKSQATVDIERLTGIAALDKKTQNCRGRWGLGCDSMFDGMENPAFVEYPCDGNDELVCITSQMSMGAIKHDMCCDQLDEDDTGHFCRGLKEVATIGKAQCEAEWDQAKFEWGKNEKFENTWRYRVGRNSNTDAANWWIGVAPDGVKVSQSSPQLDKIYCNSNSVIRENGVWVCGMSVAGPAAPNIVKQVAEGLFLAEGAKAAVSEFYLNYNRFPASNAEAGVAAPRQIQGSFVSRVTILNGVIIVRYGGQQSSADAAISGKSLLMTPSGQAGSVDWHCYSREIEHQYLPRACQ